ncbi:hypothetical protein ACFS3C_03650 [Azotobacter vinelandii]
MLASQAGGTGDKDVLGRQVHGAILAQGELSEKLAHVRSMQRPVLAFRLLSWVLVWLKPLVPARQEPGRPSRFMANGFACL